MNKLSLVALFLFCLVQLTSAQPISKDWSKWEYLLGEWQGEGSGQPGDGSGRFTLKPKLDGNILERKSRTEMAATATKPAFTHEDVMIIYKNSSGNPEKAIYFDNEGHVINYSIAYEEQKIILTSEINPAIPRFRLIYEKLDEKGVKIRFEIAMPNAPENFRMYLEGNNRKVKELSDMPK